RKVGKTARAFGPRRAGSVLDADHHGLAMPLFLPAFEVVVVHGLRRRGAGGERPDADDGAEGRVEPAAAPTAATATAAALRRGKAAGARAGPDAAAARMGRLD